MGGLVRRLIIDWLRRERSEVQFIGKVIRKYLTFYCNFCLKFNFLIWNALPILIPTFFITCPPCNLNILYIDITKQATCSFTCNYYYKTKSGWWENKPKTLFYYHLPPFSQTWQSRPQVANITNHLFVWTRDKVQLMPINSGTIDILWLLLGNYRNNNSYHNVKCFCQPTDPFLC